MYYNRLLIGPPGGGKTILSQRIPTILPFLGYNQSIEVTKIYSVAEMLKERGKIVLETPFRNPHHSASTVSIIGGGSNPMPGEVSLAHNGVLFLDELPEFRRDALEALRQPMQDGKVSISRAKGKYTYPARYMLVASMNPCPCGFYGYQLKQCKCSEVQIRSYLNRVSGPLLDRIGHWMIFLFVHLILKIEEELTKLMYILNYNIYKFENKTALVNTGAALIYKYKKIQG